MLVVGLTGGMCCGKTTVSTMFAELGCFIIDADLIARKVVEPGEPAYKKIVKFFGPSVLKKDKTLDRKKLGSLIFEDPEKRKMLNTITHPAILKEEERQIKQGEKNHHSIAIVSAALMIEVGSYKRYKKIIVVHCTKEIQIMRIMKRENVTRKEALQRIDSQLSSREKKEYGDYLINTSGPFWQTRKQVVLVYEKLKKLAEGKR